MKRYEEVEIEIIVLPAEDVITTSDPFNGSDDRIDGNW